EMKQQSASLPTNELLAVIKNFTQASSQLRNAPQPQLPLEVAFVESALRGTTADDGQHVSEKVTAPRVTPAQPSSVQQQKAAPRTTPAAANAEAPSTPRANTTATPTATNASAPQPTAPTSKSSTAKPSAGGAQLESVQEHWNDVLAAVKQQNRNLEAVLKSGRIIGLEKDVVVFGFPFEFHKSKVEEPKNKQLLEEVLGQVFQQPLRVRVDIVKGERKPVTLRPKDKNQRAMEDPLVKEAVTKYNARIAEVEETSPDQEP
ncbi:MAG: hypothetical protein LC737_11745, partial [Chloroflexi bacterium]|nr:hypothetical protein [Chloroflexota bacterium]